MPFLHIVILALVQGVTEVLPVSSSAHLLLVHELLGNDGRQENLIMDIALHVGTLAAVLFYFRRDLLNVAMGIPRSLRAIGNGGRKNDGEKIILNVIAASVPVVIAGFLIHIYEPAWTRELTITPWSLIVFGILLWLVDRFRPAQASIKDMTWKQALFIGMAQILSLVPGTSRSGITMTAARWCGFSRTEAARFSLFMAMVAISGAGVIGGIGLLEENNAQLTYDAFIAAVVSCLASYGAIVFMMHWLARATFTPFVIYRVALGVLLLVLGIGA